MNEPQYIWTDIREGLTIADYRRARRKRRSTPYRLPGAPWLIVGNTTPRRIAMP